MGRIRANMAIGDGGSLFDLLSDLPSTSRKTTTATSVSVTVGKHYLVFASLCYTSNTATVNITGATVEWKTNAFSSASSNSRYAVSAVALVTATASSMEVQIGSGTNPRGYCVLELD